MAQGPNSHWTSVQAAAFSELMLHDTRQYGIIFYEHDYRISGWNEGAYFLTGWTADEVPGQPTAMLFVPEDRERKLDEHEANTARIVGVAEDERWHLRKDGSRLWSSGVSILLPVDRQIGLLERLVEDLVDLTRVQTGKMSIAYECIRLQDCLIEAVDSCQMDAQAKNLSLVPVLPEIAIDIEVDARRLLQVFLNLLGNAIKYTPQGGTVWITATADQTHFVCNFKDNGEGISPDLLPRIFDVFTQAQNTSAARGAGLGIGLAVVREIVSLHQGSVDVRSEGPGRGSEFLVRIPLRKPHGSEPEPLPVPDSGA